MKKDDPQETFVELLKLARTNQIQLADIGMRCQTISLLMTADIVAENFPGAQVHVVRVFSEIKPSDFATNANNAVRLLRENKIEPTHIVIDVGRNIVTLGVDAELPQMPKLPSTTKPSKTQP